MSDDDDITLADLEKIEPFFRWFLTALGLLIIIGIVVASAKSWAWYWVIPIGAGLHFCTHTAKGMVSNTAQDMRKNLIVEEAAEEGLDLETMAFEDYANLSDNDQRKAVVSKEYQDAAGEAVDADEAPKLPVQDIMIVSGLMLAVGGFWYGVGKLLSFFF